MRNLLLLGLFMTLLFSCKENDEITNPIENPQVVFNYLPKKAGNYWVYQHYQIDTLGNVIELSLC